MDIYKCLDCEQEIKHNKTIGGLIIDVSIKGYDKVNQQLEGLEATLDRILEKQEKIGNSPYDINKLAEELQYYLRGKAKQTSGR